MFPTGLVTTDLTRAYPALKEWQQWGLRGARAPRGPAALRAALRLITSRRPAHPR